jgi:hypothetical protein
MPAKRSTPNGRDARGPAALPQERGRAAQLAIQPDLLIYCLASDSVPAPQASHALYRKYMRTIRRPLSNMLETDLSTRPKTSFAGRHPAIMLAWRFHRAVGDRHCIQDVQARSRLP